MKGKKQIAFYLSPESVEIYEKLREHDILFSKYVDDFIQTEGKVILGKFEKLSQELLEKK